MAQLQQYCETAGGNLVIEEGDFKFVIIKKMKLPAETSWRNHVILSVTHPEFHKRKVGELNAAELDIIETQWLPAVLEQWDEANDAQRADAAAFEAAIAYQKNIKIVKPWEL